MKDLRYVFTEHAIINSSKYLSPHISHQRFKQQQQNSALQAARFGLDPQLGFIMPGVQLCVNKSATGLLPELRYVVYGYTECRRRTYMRRCG